VSASSSGVNLDSREDTVGFVTNPFGAMPSGVADRLRREPPPAWRSPMLATLTEDRFPDPKWIFERTFDGIRLPASAWGC
jgi:hypothetical protein